MDIHDFNQYLAQEIKTGCEIALNEDIVGENSVDITAQLIPSETTAIAQLITREDGILCGQKWLETVFQILGNQVKAHWSLKDGDKMTAGQVICELQGNARQMLTGERSAMNFMQSLSATATLTTQYISEMDNTHCQLLDTRKTIPGMRFGQKYAVKCGGGTNHRIGLTDAFLIKENHIMACGGIKEALKTAKTNHPNKLLEIEVENLNELQQALDGNAEVIMLDNFDNDNLLKAVNIRNKSVSTAKLEASGNVNLNTIAGIANTGVDYISVGALTKDVKAIDLSLRVQLVEFLSGESSRHFT